MSEHEDRGYMTTAEVIEQLCVPGQGSWRSGSSRRDEREGTTTYSGFAGFPFSDEGYEFMKKIAGNPGPIRALFEAGDWPYVIFLISHTERSIIKYVESDLTVTIYDTETLWRVACRAVVAEHPAP